MEVKPAEFARICKVSQGVISRKIQNKTLIRNAAGFLDTDNPVNARYITRRREKMGVNSFESEEPSNLSASDDSARKTMMPEKMLNMTMRELLFEFKGYEGLEKYVKTLRELFAAEEKEQKNSERRLRLIEKDFVTARLFSYQDSLARQILEYPESAADEIVSLVLSSGADARDRISRKMEAGLSKILRGAKERIVRELSGLRSKYQSEDDFETRLEEKIEEKLAERDE